jgi:hypothetical protein
LPNRVGDGRVGRGKTLIGGENMRWVKRSAALAAICVAGQSLAAEPAPRPPIVTPPPMVRVVAPPVPSPPADLVKASGLANGRRVELLVQGERAAIREWPAAASNRLPDLYELTNSATVIALLADRNYAFLWDELTRWAGADLGLYRERLRQQAVAISNRSASLPPMTSAESATSPRVADFIRLTAIYLQIGEPALAEQVMATYLAAVGPKGRSTQQTNDWILAKARLATVLQVAGKVDESYRQYADIQAQAGRSDYALNGMVNHAAVLAENGRHAEALALIDAAWDKYRKEAGDEGLAGSERQFAWIRACALDGLGRPAEADAAYRVVRNSGQVADRDFIVDRKESIEWRAHWCRRREPELKALLLAELAADRPTIAALVLQPAYKSELLDSSLLARLRADPHIQAALAGRVRVLPPAMIPALNRYR